MQKKVIKKIPKVEQFRIIGEIRRGNSKLREEFIMQMYDRVVNYVLSLNLKEE